MCPGVCSSPASTYLPTRRMLVHLKKISLKSYHLALAHTYRRGPPEVGEKWPRTWVILVHYNIYISSSSILAFPQCTEQELWLTAGYAQTLGTCFLPPRSCGNIWFIIYRSNQGSFHSSFLGSMPDLRPNTTPQDPHGPLTYVSTFILDYNLPNSF